jgi:hypothetical protein
MHRSAIDLLAPAAFRNRGAEIRVANIDSCTMNGTGLQFEKLEHGGEYPDTMPQAIKLIDADGRSCIYVPITQNGKVIVKGTR